MINLKMPNGERGTEIIFKDEGIEKLISELKEDLADRSGFLFTDENVFRIYGERLLKSFGEMLYFVMCTGEEYKTEETLFALLTHMSQANLLRTSVLICVGGGIALDIGGLAASLYMRGITHVHVPTTLLAQTDACIGGKTAINFKGIKNLVGTFYPPTKVYIEPEFLTSLPQKEIICGLGEIVKHGALCPEIFELLNQNRGRLTEKSFLKEAVPRSLAFKASVIEQDPYEKGLRKILNLGHTTAHALEMSGNGLSHGESVLCGILLESVFASRYSPDEAFLERLKELCLEALGGMPKLCVDESIMRAALLDKKNAKTGKVSLTLVTAAGKYEFLELPLSEYVEGIKLAEKQLC